MKRTFAYSIAAAAALVASAPAIAGAVVGGFNASTMPNIDDTFVGPVALGFSANYFGSTYTTTNVGTNGYVTFVAGQSGYSPVGLGAGYSGNPIIAAFYADVDTRNGGSIGYGAGSFDGRNAFGVTWNEVAVFGGSTDNKRNTFQLLLVDRADTGAGNFDIVLNYDQIKWETGSASGSNGTNGLGGNSAAVGYNAAQGGAVGTYFSFAGSQTPGSFLDGRAGSLVANSNIGVAGRYLFNVRNGAVTPPPSGAVPEPATWAMMIGGFGMIGASLRYRRRKTTVSFA